MSGDTSGLQAVVAPMAGPKQAPRICDSDGSGMFLGPMGSGERPDIFLGAIMGVLLVYTFMGVSIIADIFMNSIEMVTSWKRKVISQETGRKVTVPLWNDTVATLTLMALGSSAPEIFLAVIEVIKKKFHAGSLGPSTIVGSAAFNQFVIIAVCISVIPPKEVRRIVNVRAFLVTAVFSLGAYMWMVFVLVVHGKDVVDVYEALMTFLYLPLLVWLSYSIDVGALCKILDRYYPPKVEEALPFDETYRIGFETDVLVVPGTSDNQSLEVIVYRTGGKKGSVSCNYRTERLTAIPGYDFEEASGTLEFANESATATITLDILSKSKGAVSRSLLLILEATEDSKCDFDAEQDGSTESGIMTVKIEPKDSSRSISKRLDRIVNPNSQKFALTDWKYQIIGVFFVNGSLEDQRDASRSDWVFHFLSFPWRLLFCLVPPTSFCGGWLCFVGGIAGIGFCTAIVSDLAEMFGCLLDIPDIITATVFVALGTSMPDLFASMTAAISDPSADASVVNVAGSNAVNVFLGLGVPWTAAAFYWDTIDLESAVGKDWAKQYPRVASNPEYVGRVVFVVESADLGFCVFMYCGLCTLAILLLCMRRAYLGGVLGGPRVPKYLSSILLVWLWLAFAATTSWRVIRCEGADPGQWCKASVEEIGGVFSAVFCSVLVILVPTLVSVRCYQKEAKQETQKKQKIYGSKMRASRSSSSDLSPTSPRGEGEDDTDIMVESPKSMQVGEDSANSEAQSTSAPANGEGGEEVMDGSWVSALVSTLPTSISSWISCQPESSPQSHANGSTAEGDMQKIGKPVIEGCFDIDVLSSVVASHSARKQEPFVMDSSWDSDSV